MAEGLLERLSFVAEWFQKEAHLKRIFLLNYFPYDNNVELFDQRTNRTFLKRCKAPNLSEKNFRLNAKVNIFGRQMILTNYADESTKNKLICIQQRTFGLILPKYTERASKIIRILIENGFSISNCAMVELSKQQSVCFANSIGACCELANDISLGPSIAIELNGSDAINMLQKLILGVDEVMASDEAILNTMYYADRSETVSKALHFFFSKEGNFEKIHLSKSFINTTLCLIKPHAVRDGFSGEIMYRITENGFLIRAMKMFDLQSENSEEFFEVYKGVVPEYLPMVTELSSGPFVALEIGVPNENQHAYNQFREFCGPRDPIVANKIRPNTLRAQFGEDIVQNAVHCTDLKEDCLLELEYFFTILSQ